MKIFLTKTKTFSYGIWFALFALFLIFLAWIMQAYSISNWEAAVEMGLQNESFMGSQTERAIADVERGIAIADLIWVLPLTLCAFIGLLRKKLYGFVTAQMVFGICVYFPLFYAFRKNMDSHIVLAALFLWAIPSFIGIIALWINRKIYLNNEI